MDKQKWKNTVQVRLTAVTEQVDMLAGKIVDLLELEAYDVVEWSRAYTCLAPEQDKSRVFLTAVPMIGNQGEKNEKNVG